MKEPKTTVAFRLEKELRKLLTEKAKRLGLSAGSYARLLVTEALLDARQALLLDEVRQVKQRQLGLEQSLRLATLALLCDAGKASPEEAEQFVRERLS